MMYGIVKAGKVIGTSDQDLTEYLGTGESVFQATGVEVGMLWNGITLSSDPEYQADIENVWVESELKDTHHYIVDDYPLSSAERIAMLTYRQELRTYNTSDGFPFGSRPVRPEV